MNPADLATWKKAGYGNYPQVAYFYDANGNMEYVAIGSWGAATSDASWLVFKLGYSANGFLSTQKSSPSNSILDNRTSLTYT